MTHHSPEPFIPAQPLSETLPAIIEQLPPDSDHPPQTQFTRVRQRAFLQRLADSGEVRVAARASNVSHQTVYRLRRSCPAFRTGWDAALLVARERAEEALATRALHGVEEEVFYHGEVVAKRRRYSDRLLLAHLGRLDKLAEREDVAALAGAFDDVLEAFAQAGENGAAEEGEVVLPDAVREPVRELAPDTFSGPCNTRSMSPAQALADDEASEDEPECEPCPDCGGACEDPDAELTEADCQWLGNRLERFYAARPAKARYPWEMATDRWDTGEVEWAQVLAYEAGEAQWWEAMPGPPDAEEEEGDGDALSRFSSEG